MMIKRYRIADTVFAIDSMYDEVHKLCEDYESDDPADFTIHIRQEEINFERERSEKTDISEGIPVRTFSDSYLETLAVYRKLSERLIDEGVILFHGSAIAVDGMAYLFTAKSGTGKSTHARLWRQRFGERAVMINDDKPLIRIAEDGVVVYGTPWDGKHRISTNTSAPLKAICLLSRGTENKIRKISKSEAYPMLLQQTYRPMHTDKMQRVFTLLDMLCKRVVLYSLACTISPDAAMTAYEGMNQEEG